MTRFFGWDRSGMPVRDRSTYLASEKCGGFLATEEIHPRSGSWVEG